MKNPTSYLIAATLCVLCPGWLQAQTFNAPLTVTGTAPSSFEFRADGTLISKGSYGTGSLLSGDQGAGTRMLWFPAKGAFRVGQVSGNQWDAANIGPFSIAMGKDASANGTSSIAIGEGAYTQDQQAVAIGHYTWAYAGSVAIGTGANTDDTNAVAIGPSSAYMGSSVAIGYGNWAWYNGIAIGSNNFANGYNAAAIGYSTRADAYSSFAVGCYNVGGGDSWSWVATDPLFEIGNGTADNARSSALVVYKNGAIKMAKRQGDIVMGEFGNGNGD
ncbi:MAG: hypothetical protein PHC88_03445 [Terrimicrobiaceae bacterium]|nr:hypothetical protein [Terrimicrobiaceae bacterium]